MDTHICFAKMDGYPHFQLACKLLGQLYFLSDLNLSRLCTDMSSELESRGPDGYPHLLCKWMDTHISHLLAALVLQNGTRSNLHCRPALSLQRDITVGSFGLSTQTNTRSLHPPMQIPSLSLHSLLIIFVSCLLPIYLSSPHPRRQFNLTIQSSAYLPLILRPQPFIATNANIVQNAYTSRVIYGFYRQICYPTYPNQFQADRQIS